MPHAPAFIITLERNIQRAKQNQQRLAEMGIQADLWMGVDGTRPINFNPGESVDTDTFRLLHLRNPLPTEAGCSLAHYRLWQHALKQQHERIIIMEDDSTPLPHLKEVMPRLLDLDGSYECINLPPRHTPQLMHSNYAAYLNIAQPLGSHHMLTPAFDVTYGTDGYIISRSGIQKLLPLLMPIHSPLDVQIRHARNASGLRMFNAWPPLMFHGREHNIISGFRGQSRRRKVFLMLARPDLWRRRQQMTRQLDSQHRKYARECLREHTRTKSNFSGNPARPDLKAPPAFIISTPNATRQLASTASALQHLGVEAQQWQGLHINQIKLQPGESAAGMLHGQARPHGVIAQYLSHYRLLQHALKQGMERIIVMENGTVPFPAFKSVAANLAQLSTSFEMIALTTANVPEAVRNQRHEYRTTLPNSHSLVPALDITLPAAYMISLEGIRKLLPLLMPIRSDLARAFTRTLWAHNVRGYETWPPAVSKNTPHTDIVWNASRKRSAPVRVINAISRKLAPAAHTAHSTTAQQRLQACLRQAR